MSLLTAHKILISTAIVLFGGYAALEMRRFAAGEGVALGRAALAGLAVVGLSIYLRWVWTRRPGAPPRR